MGRVNRSHAEFWSSRLGFILANIGAAVGLGSIWKFPYEVGTNGGAAFILFYLLGLVLIVFPLMLVEFAIGRRGQADAAGSIVAVARELGASSHWGLAGVLAVCTGFLILSFYSVIGGWALAYVVETIRSGLGAMGRAAAQERFDQLLASPIRLIFYHSLFMALTAVIVGRGIASGIENASRILMPILVVLIAGLAAYSSVTGDLAGTLRFLFSLDVSRITPDVAIEALGLGFFSIGVGLGIMITYAAYVKSDVDLRQVAIATIVGDTAVSLLAGLAVFPVVFAEKLDPASGPGLVFVTLPLAFAQMPLGTLAAISFFVLLSIAALASAIALLELPVALFRNKLAWPRGWATVIAAVSCWTVGLATVFSFNLWADWFPLRRLAGSSATVFDLLDYATSNLLLPVAGLALAIFAGWSIEAKVLAMEIGISEVSLNLLKLLLRYVIPASIAVATIVPLLS